MRNTDSVALFIIYSSIIVVPIAVLAFMRWINRTTRPGHYRVIGVDRSTRKDVSTLIEAPSEASAKAKAELSGMVVNKVEYFSR